MDANQQPTNPKAMTPTMLPKHPLLSDSSAQTDPHQQWALLCKSISPGDRSTLDASFRLALRVHAAQWRKSAGDTPPIPYIVHPVRVARILAEEWERRECEPLATALLHDVLEDCPPGQQEDYAREITRIAGEAVCEAVWTLTKPHLPQAVPSETKAHRDAEYFKEVRAAPRWVRLVKCADRVDNLRDALLWGDVSFWNKYRSETIGWHLFLARETAPIAEVALFKSLVEGERALHGRVPFWADGHPIDPAASRLVPEHIARRYSLIGMAKRGATLIVGTEREPDESTLADIRRALNGKEHAIEAVEPLLITSEALNDALAAGLYRRIDSE